MSEQIHCYHREGQTRHRIREIHTRMCFVRRGVNTAVDGGLVLEIFCDDCVLYKQGEQWDSVFAVKWQ